MLEDFGMSSLHLSLKGKSQIAPNEKKATITFDDLNELTRNIDRITSKTQRIALKLKRNLTSQVFFELISNNGYKHDEDLESVELAKLMGVSIKFTEGGATKKEQSEAMDVITKNARKIIAEQHEQVMKLCTDIELVNLEAFINEFEAMLDKNHNESHWQRLFNANPFILNMVFGIPIVKIEDQASLGGIKLSGKGNKIADFLVKNSMTGNAAIVELKTPSTKLINTGKYRDGVFAPAIELTAAVNQVLDQIYRFQKEINSLKVESREYELYSYAVQGFLIVGRSLEYGEQQSFELFRGNSKNVQIITFDELLLKMKNLYHLLAPEKESVVKSQTIEPNNNEDDLPF
ncbi:MAG: DUF4263 domain-containing protein [Agriterribacter sp.]